MLITSPPTWTSVVSNARSSEFISDHAVVLGHFDFISPSVPGLKCYLLEVLKDKSRQFGE